MTLPNHNDHACSFCQKLLREVLKMIAGPSVSCGASRVQLFICNECVALCAEVMVDEAKKEWSKLKPDAMPEAVTAFAALSAEREAIDRRHEEDQRAAREDAAKLRSALRRIGQVVGEAYGYQVHVRCMWCGAEQPSDDAAREHVATCEKHPAVIRLHEIEAARSAP